MALLSTSTVFGLVHGLHHLKVPDKLVHLFFFSFRYIHVIHMEYHKIINAMKARGFEPDTSLRTYKSYAYLIGTLFLKSSERSKRIDPVLRDCLSGRFEDGTFLTFIEIDALAVGTQNQVSGESRFVVFLEVAFQGLGIEFIIREWCGHGWQHTLKLEWIHLRFLLGITVASRNTVR